MNEETPLGPLPDPAGHDELSPTARQLQDALAARAAGVQPTDRLEEIHMTSRANRRRSRTRGGLVAAGVAAVVVVGGGAFALTQRGDDNVTTVASTASSSTSPSSSTPSTSSSTPAADSTPMSSQPTGSGGTSAATSLTSAPATSTAGGTGGTLPTGATSVPVYWLGGQPAKLYREYVKAGSGANDATNALRAMLSGSPTDPDYSSPWSKDATATVSESGGKLVVDVAASAASGSTGDATLALQQLVYTVTAAAGDDQPIELRVGGKAGQSVFGTSVPASLSRAPQADVQAPAWITSVSPSAGSVTVKGVGTGFEGTLLYTLTNAAGAEVARDSVQAGANGTFAEFSFTAAVPAGTYTLSVFAPDESDGEGAGPVGDTKTVTIP
ncbi:Gmad2 immunoglobulin-like domain-containing protein [Kineococcus sp. R86509]|uniref:Gmad2 immunoglobulin-like domain-containing protein n=1 Tax=Kineococcus sp. R86509 TaxID=3093851 RepID=UPI0036D363A2